MPRDRARRPIEGLEGAGWYVGDPRNVTNRSNARYPAWLSMPTACAAGRGGTLSLPLRALRKPHF